MGDSGSETETETDDEMTRRRHAPLTRPSNARARGSAALVKSASNDRLEIAPRAATHPPTSPGTAPCDASPPSPPRRAGFLSLILNSDDDEPPRFPDQKTGAPTLAGTCPPASTPMDAPPVSVAVANEPASPAEDHFVSPFASLALLSARGPAPTPQPPVSDAPVAIAAPVPAPVSAAGSAPTPDAPPTPQRKAPAPPTGAADASQSCVLCREPLGFAPARVGKQCNCCMLTLPLAAFSKNQLRPDHPCRRCSSCVKAREMPAKFRGIHQKVNPLKPNGPLLTKAQQARARRAAAKAQGTPAVSTNGTEEERREMEVEVRNFKLAKRSLQRRRADNDLRGSTREEYIKQLDEEERRVDAKMAKARSRNPALFDELNDAIKVKRASLTREDREDGANPKKKPKKAAKAKRISADPVASLSPSPSAKRARASPASAKTSPTNKKTASTSVVSSDNDSDYEASTPRTVATRSRTRQAAQPVVLIDLVDSDSD